MDKERLQEAARIAEGLKRRQHEVSAVIQAFMHTAKNPEKDVEGLGGLLRSKVLELKIDNLSKKKLEEISNIYARCTEAVESELRVLGAKWDSVKPVMEKILKEYSLEE